MERLTVREKVCYSFGDVASCIIFQGVMLFIANFYTDTFGIPAATAGTLMMITRIWDTINDPMLGIIADRTNTRWGKFRPWLLWMAAPFGICGVLLYVTPNFSVTGKIIYALITYNLMMMVYTAINIPYSALSGVMTPSPVERTDLSAYRFIGAFTGNLIVSAFTLDLVQMLGKGSDPRGYRLTATIYGVICTILFLITFLGIKERVHPPKKQRTTVKQDIADLFHNGPWVALALLSLFTLIYVAIRSSVILYYFKYYVEQKEWPISLFGHHFQVNITSAFLVVGTVSIILTLKSAKWLARTFGKRNVYIGCMVAAAATSFAFYFARPTDLLYLFIMQILFSIPSGLTMPLLWSMFGDAADYGEWKNGRRATGLVFSAATMAQKFGMAVGGPMSLWLLAFYDYVPNVEQTARSLFGIKMMLSIYPAIGAVVCAVIVWFYPLKDKLLGQIETELTARRVESGDEPTQ